MLLLLSLLLERRACVRLLIAFVKAASGDDKASFSACRDVRASYSCKARRSRSIHHDNCM